MADVSPPSGPRAANPQAASFAPHAVLFACGLNSVRSPMAAALLRYLRGAPLYVASVGVRAAEVDPFAVAAMEEIGIDIAGHRPITFEELEDLEGLNFDLIVTLSPEAHHKALALTHRLAAEVEYWPTADPADVEGNRAQRLDAYRAVRDQLLERIRQRFAPPAGIE
jgi:protein-tyrosine-phosphatase